MRDRITRGRAWIVAHRVGVIVTAATAAFVLTLFAITFAVNSSSDPAPSDTTPDYLTQTEQAALDPTPTSTDTTLNGNLPSEAVPVTDLLARLDTATAGQFTASVVNGYTFVTAVVDMTGINPVILTAKYLPSQGETLLTAYAEAGAPATVTGSASGTLADPVGTRGPVGERAGNSDGSTFFIVLAVIAILGMFMWYLARRTTIARQDDPNLDGPSSSRGRSRDEKDTAVPVPDTRFDDVAGCDEAITELREIALFINEPERFDRLGATMPKGALLVGPPGTGKTLLARALAGECGIPFYAASASEFVEMYVGVGAKRVRDLFEKARKHERAIVFIDEIDAIGGHRGDGAATAHSEDRKTLNQLLTEMDGFHQGGNVFVIGATNLENSLDAALKRSGRFDKKVQVPLPDVAGRRAILDVHARGKTIEPGVDFDHVARRTPGMSGADLAQIVNEACIQGAREGAVLVTQEHFDHAIETVAMGPARTSAVVTDHDRTMTAWHEGGHTVAMLALPDHRDARSVSIVPRGRAGGVTWSDQGDDAYLTRRQAFARLVVAMAGRAAEEMYLDGEFTSGPSGDLEAATDVALAMVTRYGMTGTGLMVKSDRLLSTGSQVTVDTVKAVEDLLGEALDHARQTLAAHSDLLDAVVAELLDKETLRADALQRLKAEYVGGQVTPVPPAPPKDYRPVVVASPVPVTSGPRTPVTRRRSPVFAAAATFLTQRGRGRSERGAAIRA
jgi:cell division protease FtsH